MRNLLAVFALALASLFVSDAAVAQRVQAASNTDFYVAPATASPPGSNSNDCLSASTPCLTGQYVVNLIHDGYDLRGYKATVHFADGTYSDCININGPFTGALDVDSVTLVGNMTTWDNVIFNCSGTAVNITAGARVTVQGVKINTGSTGLAAQDGGSKLFFSAIDFGTTGAAPGYSPSWTAGPYSRVRATGDYTISGSFWVHALAPAGQAQIYNGVHVTILSSASCTGYFLFGQELGLVDAASVTFTGGSYITCGKQAITFGGVVYSSGSVIPGDAAKNYP